MTAAAILFDLDGTLLDTADDLADSVNSMLARLGAPSRTVDECKLMTGYGLEELVRRALPPSMRDAKTLAEAVRLTRGAYADRWSHKTRPYPGIVEMLHAVAAHCLPVAVLSNKPEEFTRKAVETLLAGIAFEQVVGARPDVPKKPDPAAALAIAEALRIDPSQCWLVGDSDIDMQTAAGAGMKAIGVLWGFRDEAELRGAGAEILLAHPSELLDHLARGT